MVQTQTKGKALAFVNKHTLQASKSKNYRFDGAQSMRVWYKQAAAGWLETTPYQPKPAQAGSVKLSHAGVASAFQRTFRSRQGFQSLGWAGSFCAVA